MSSAAESIERSPAGRGNRFGLGWRANVIPGASAGSAFMHRGGKFKAEHDQPTCDKLLAMTVLLEGLRKGGVKSPRFRSSRSGRIGDAPAQDRRRG
jgi:hypothetical protein